MSIPAFAWAVERGREHDLKPHERLVLIVLADRANGKLFCWPSLTQLANDTGLVRRTIFSVVHRLAELALIRIERQPKGQIYHILRPKDDTEPVQRSPKKHNRKKVHGLHRSKAQTGAPDATVKLSTGAHHAPVTGAPDAPVQTSTGANDDTRPVQNPHPTGAPVAPKPLREPIKEPYAREARSAAVADAPSEASKKEVLKNDLKEGGTPPPAPTPDSCGDPYAGSAATKAWMSRQLGRPVHLAMAGGDAVAGHVPEADEPVAPVAVNALVKGLGRSMRHFELAPGQKAERDKWQQIEQNLQEPPANPLQPQDPQLSVEAQIAAALAGCSPEQIEKARNYGREPVTVDA